MNRPLVTDLYKLYDPKELGESLREVAQDIIVTEAQDVRGRWFHSARDLDLYLWYDERDVLIKQQLCYFGQVIEWNIVNGVKTGFLMSDSEKHPSSEIIKHDEVPNKFTVIDALKLLENITELTVFEKSMLAHNFVDKKSDKDKDISTLLTRFEAKPLSVANFNLWLYKFVTSFVNFFRKTK